MTEDKIHSRVILSYLFVLKNRTSRVTARPSCGLDIIAKAADDVNSGFKQFVVAVD